MCVRVREKERERERGGRTKTKNKSKNRVIWRCCEVELPGKVLQERWEGRGERVTDPASRISFLPTKYASNSFKLISYLRSASYSLKLLFCNCYGNHLCRCALLFPSSSFLFFLGSMNEVMHIILFCLSGNVGDSRR